MFTTKLTLVVSSPHRKEVKVNGEIYLKTQQWNRIFYLLKLFLMVGPLVAVLFYNLLFREAPRDIGMDTCILLLTLMIALMLIQLVVTQNILEQLEKRENL